MSGSTPQPIPERFAERLLAWFDHSGRHDLPWQRDTSPYRVWVSEIMLQQTQVATVIPYYRRFMEALPTVQHLAAAEADTVLHLWSGLGYYSRARNLHRAAQMVCQDFGGEVPGTVDELETLPGIGRSTGGTLVSIAFQRRAAILDGNVKRVLARHRAIAGWPGQSATLKQLWQLAEALTPSERVADYTQAIMDLGATACSRSKPDCGACPVSDDCLAHERGEQALYPGKKPKKALPLRHTQMLMIENPAGEWLLEKRPERGIWGGLWSFPELASDLSAADHCAGELGAPAQAEHWPTLRHTFSHYQLDIQPVHLKLARQPAAVMEAGRQLWYNSRTAPDIGLAAPVQQLLDTLQLRSPRQLRLANDHSD